MLLTIFYLSVLAFRFLIEPVRKINVRDSRVWANGSFGLLNCMTRAVNHTRESVTWPKSFVAIGRVGMLALFITSTNVTAQGLVDEAAALSGLPGLYVLGGDIDDSLSGIGLEKGDLLDGVTAILYEYAVPVLSEMDWLQAESAPVVHIDLRAEAGVYRIQLEVLYLVHPVSSPGETTYAVIWSRDHLGQISSNVAADIVNASLDLAIELATDFNSNM